MHGKLGQLLVIANQHVDTQELLADEEVLFRPLQAVRSDTAMISSLMSTRVAFKVADGSSYHLEIDGNIFRYVVRFCRGLHKNEGEQDVVGGGGLSL